MGTNALFGIMRMILHDKQKANLAKILHYGNVLVYEGKMIITGFDLLEQENQK
ncbi:9317_t:CDS:2, partial [Gigaspora margarita]